MRDTFVKNLVEIAKKNDKIYLVIADLGFSVVEKFEKRFPDRFINVGIAEANAVSIAAGLALSGKIPYVYSIVPFLTMRAFEQVRLDCAYMKTRVRLVGVGGGVSYGPAGATHHAIEDIAIMRTLPDMTVIAPGDPWEAENAVKKSVDIDGPVYIRLAKNREPILSDVNADFSIGKVNIYREGEDITLITTGNTYELGTEITDLLLAQGIKAELANMHTIKPFDSGYIQGKLLAGKPIFTLEEHNIIGGLGSAVAEIIAESRCNPVFKRFAIPDKYSHYVGSQNYIRSQWGLTKEKIAGSIIEELN